MRYLDGEDVARALTGVISEKHQRHAFETDLTVREVFRITGPGAVDFGGSEEEPAPREIVAPVKRREDDSYGWWDLAPGSYVLRFNESPELEDDQVAFLQPHERLLQAGASHCSYHFRGHRDHLETLITVGSGGIRLKENARVSKLLVVQLI